MSAKRSGLGRGLDALLPKTDKGLQQAKLAELKVSKYQPRKTIEKEALAELSASIADKGVLQPLLVRPLAKGYEIVAGERRFRAAKQAGLDAVPIVIKDLSDQETLEIAIIENLQREDLNAVEEAQAFKQLMDFGLSQDGVARAVGKSRSAIANTLRLLKLSKRALDALSQSEISAGHARAILALDKTDQDWALEQILDKSLSVREAEQLKAAKEQRNDSTKVKKAAQSSGLVRELEEDLTRFVGSRVKISGTDRGKIEIHYHSEDELQRLFELLGYQA